MREAKPGPFWIAWPSGNCPRAPRCTTSNWFGYAAWIASHPVEVVSFLGSDTWRDFFHTAFLDVFSCQHVEGFLWLTRLWFGPPQLVCDHLGEIQHRKEMLLTSGFQ